MAKRHLIGLLLATEVDWPAAFEAMIGRVGLVRYGSETHELETERIKNEPFDLRYTPPYSIVIDRLSWWYDLPREWLKKVALMDDVYLLNNPFTFQAMEKHAAYCAMMRLGLKVPATWLIPHKLPPDNPRYVPMAERYNRHFDPEEVGEAIGFPLFMKPFDGGMWVGVSRITSGPQTKVMRFDPAAHGNYRYVVEHDCLSQELEAEVATISRLVNAFFRWEFNSSEVIVKNGQAHPIDYANASPDVALASLHYYFPWAIKSLVAWCTFCAVTGRRMRINQNTRDYFEAGDDDELPYEEKLDRYATLADAYFQTKEFEEFRATALPHLDELMVDYIESPEFDAVLVSSMQAEVEAERQEEMIERSRSSVASWVADERAGAT